MTLKEIQDAFKKLKKEGMDDDEILGRLYMMFQDDVIDIDELEACCNILGYEFTDEFREMSPEQQKTDGYVDIDDEEEV